MAAAADGMQVYPSFHWPVRVYYEDTDAGGVVYHSNYLKFMERARTERIRSVGFELDELVRDHGILFVVRSMAIDFKKPAHFNESLSVSADFKATLAIEQPVQAGARSDTMMMTALGANAKIFFQIGVIQHRFTGRTFTPQPFRYGLSNITFAAIDFRR